MQKKITLAIAVLLLIPFFLKADWVPLSKSTSNPAPPVVTLISDDNSSTVIKVEIPGFAIEEFEAEGQIFQRVDIFSESFTNQNGEPELPYLAKVLAIPDIATTSVEIIETGEIHTYQDIDLPPARMSWQEGFPETPYIQNLETYHSNNIYPSVQAEMDAPSVFRDFRISRVAIYPVRYIPAKKEIQVVSSITIKINYGTGDIINPKSSPKKPIAPSFGELYNNFIFNYQSVLEKSYNGKEEGHELMLCIVPDEFYNSFLPFADWKRQSGIDIHITKFSDIGANNSDPDIIRNHIADAYFNWDVTPTYALLVGDADVIPYYTSSGYIDENYYVEIDGGDYFPDMMLGRFTNQSDYQMQIMINKFIKYEQQPYIAQTDWFKKGICCSNDAYPSQIDTKRYAAEKMLEGGFTSVDTMMSDPGCTYSNADVSAAINQGRSFLNYRGEGWTSGWWATCTPFTNSQVSNLNNGEKLTFVTSIGCGVAMFGSGESFGETWIELGTLSSPRGAAGFIGPAGNTHTTYNNKIDKGIYKGMFTEGLTTAGQGLARGRLYLYNVYGTDPYVQYHYKIYCILGDPSIHPWKDIPQDVTVSHPSSIVFGNSIVEFTVNHTASGQPVDKAIVCVTGNEIFSTGITDSTGKAYLEISSTYPETLTVTVTGPDVYPHEGTMDVVPPVGPWCIEDYFTLDDNEGGNGNGLMDFGEFIFLSLAIENIGTDDASNVIVEIETTDPYITIVDDYHVYPSIPAGQSVYVGNGFSFSVADNMPDEHEVFVSVTARMGITIWDSYFAMTGHAPVLAAGNIAVSDQLPIGNGNGILDPGEDATLVISVINNGTGDLPEATAVISSESSFITINSASVDLGQIDAGASIDAMFDISVDPTTPLGESVAFDFDVLADQYSIASQYSINIGMQIEDWETGDFNKFPWVMGGNADWTIVTENPQQGIYCARSGNITDNQSSELEITITTTTDGDISFYRKVSSENNYDYLRFYIDGSLVDEWEGNEPWAEEVFPVSIGEHTFKWAYEKDYSVSSGEDCAWIDNILFPYTEPPVFFTLPYQTDFDIANELPEGWKNETDDDINWTINSGSTPSPHTGPTGDHTTGSGYYLYTEATYFNPDYRADLTSPYFDMTQFSDATATFWYHMWDDNYNHMGILHLDLFHNDTWIEDVMTPISGNQGNQWQQQTIDLSAYAGEVIKLRFRGITGPDWASDICIDDFSIDGTLMPTYMNLDITTMLEGPCEGGSMSTFLCACSAIPLTQPYHVAPWNYYGVESVLVMPGNVVDWVLVELRDAASAGTATASTMIARQAGLLLDDGTIVSTDGVSPLYFDNTVSNGLYLVVYHRNHLPVLSNYEVTQTGDNYTYNFSTSVDMAYGPSSLKEMPGGIWCMIAGDADANGSIENADINPDWVNSSGNAGYYQTDFNLDQQVNNVDKDDYWQPNVGMGTNVPD